MTTSMSTEGTQQQPAEELWKTSAAASPWQIFTSSNAAFVATPGVGTMPLDDIGLSVVFGLERLDLQEPKLDKQPAKEQLQLFSRDPLEYALLNVLTYSPGPDEPSDQDVGPHLDYRFPL